MAISIDVVRRAILLSSTFAAYATRSGAQRTSPADSSSVATIIVAHGAGPQWNAQVEALATRVRTGGPVEVSYLMGDGASSHRFQNVVRRLEERGVSQIIVVPLLVSSHSGHYEQIRYLAGDTLALDSAMLHHLHMAGLERATSSVPMRVSRAMDGAPEIARVLADRALAVAPRPVGRALFIVGHGPNSAEDYAAWMRNLRTVADLVRAHTGFTDVRVDLIRDDAPEPVRAEAVRRVRELIELQHLATKQDVVVVPVLVARGEVNDVTVPRDLAGLPITYRGDALLPHPAVAKWVESRVRETAALSKDSSSLRLRPPEPTR